MDIPAPNNDEKSNAPKMETVTVLPTPDTPAEQTADPVSPAKAAESATNKQDEANKKIAELINSKKYNLTIKERRTKPLLVFSILPKKKKKNSLKKKKKSKKDEKPHSKHKKTIQIVAVVLIWVGLFLAVDVGWLDIGVKLPFTLFGS